ncbi:hypothetical protein J7I93_10030 [Bacillus sp. ISL-47]|uniref:hypothetical protein n=1 Tax=Bacillus sp. ISL-47 TaxID=2819130 RepID=UPI001BE99472|nr:hypothetical protein [Bacillus sp. ISL-47]MBT2688521.1 hypothetical protein [Bacillus sp. ISL-47]MBT2708819.1 hypothetical protein [Pseudomonas sp. ISL-84]
MRRKINIIIMVFLCLFLMVSPLQTAGAGNTEIKVTLDEGFGGKVKRGKGFPLRIKLENTGESFSGDLLISYHPSYNTGGAISVDVELPAGSMKEYLVSMPGMTEDHPSIYQNIPSLTLYQGDWKNGKKVSFKGEDTIKPKFIDMSSKAVGVLSEKYDRLKELRTLPSMSIQMIELKKEELPNQSIGLETLDYLLVDEYGVSQLSEQQQIAIKDWVYNGGVLIAGAAPDASQSYGELYSLLPMKAENETTGAADFLQSTKDTQRDFDELNFFTGPVDKDSAIISKSGELPVTLVKEFGSGSILQTAFSLGDEPLASWKGYSTWFAGFLKHASSASTGSNPYGQEYLDQLYWEFAEANEFFPASNFSIGQLIGLFAGYIVLIVPVLYFVLRKLDKREHSWWVIPSLAFLMAAAVFGMGAKDRISQPQLNQMGIFKVNNQLLSGYQASTLLSNKSGEYKLSMPKSEFNAVVHTNNSSTFDPLRGGIMAEKIKHNEIIFPKVDYWSSKTIYGKAQTEIKEKFTADLTLKDKSLTGTITNGFDYDFEELYIWSGNEAIKLGPLKKGETINVDKTTKQSLLTRPYAGSFNGSYPNNGNNDISQLRKERLEFASSTFLLGDVSQPVLAGITKDAVINVTIDKKNEKQNNTNLILQPFEAVNEFSGSFTLKDGMMAPDWNVIQGQIYEKGMGGSHTEMMLEDGEYEYILNLPKQLADKSYSLDEISIRINSHAVQYSVKNHKTDKWLPIEPDQRSLKLTSKDDLSQFISKEGKFILKLYKSAQGDPYVQLPAITIKGEVAK